MAQELRPPSVNYNMFFHPNLCHVCKLEEQTKLKLCQCRMISYCSEQHRLLHREEHKDVCDVIQDTFKNRNFWNTCNMGSTEWTKYKWYTLAFLTAKMQRNLRQYENQMFIYAKSCFVCRQQKNLIYVCDICKSINMCPDHKNNYREHDCDNLRKCLDMDIFHANSRRILLPQSYLPLEVKSNDMTSFIIENSRSSHDKQTEPLLRHRFAEYLTQPLTLLFGIKHLNFLHSRFTVMHVVCPFSRDKDALMAWEIVLHVLHSIKTLIIVMIHSELPEAVRYITLCRYCNSHQKSLEFNFVGMKYNEYVNSSLYRQPNIIIMYHVMFKNNETSVSILNAVKRAQCPLFLTYPTRKLAQENIDIIGLKSMYYDINNFASTRPYRFLKDGAIFFYNKYLIIYEKLPLPGRDDLSSSSIKKASCSQHRM